MSNVPEVRPPLPPFTRESAIAKVRAAEDGWNTRDPARKPARDHRRHPRYQDWHRSPMSPASSPCFPLAIVWWPDAPAAQGLMVVMPHASHQVHMKILGSGGRKDPTDHLPCGGNVEPAVS